MRTVQVDSCLNSEQIDTLFISVGGQEGGLGRGVHFGPEAQNLHVTVMNSIFCTLLRTKGLCIFIFQGTGSAYSRKDTRLCGKKS